MTAPSLNASQTALIAAIDIAFETALRGGVSNNDFTVQMIQALSHYDEIKAELHAAVRASFEAVVAAYLINASLPGAVGFSSTDPLAKLTPGGTNGSLTFVNGICTAKVDPT